MARYFSPEEIAGLDEALVEKLDHARGFAHVPFRITSGFRTPEENRAAGGVPHSAHTRGLAIDLSCSDDHMRMRIATALIIAGFNRIGLYNLHIHADLDETLPQNVLWLGVSH